MTMKEIKNKPASENDPLPEKKGLLDSPYRLANNKTNRTRRVLLTTSVGKKKEHKKDICRSKPIIIVNV